MNEFFEISVYFFLSLMFFITVVISIRKRFFVVSLLFGGFFFVTLLALIPLLSLVMIDDIILIQVDATIIAGILIFLTISSFVSNKTRKPIITFGVGWTPIQVSSGVIGAFGLSAITLLLGNIELGKILAVFGFIILIGVSIIISVKEPRGSADT